MRYAATVTAGLLLGALGIALATAVVAFHRVLYPGIPGDPSRVPEGASQLRRVGDVWTYADAQTEEWHRCES